MNSARIRTFTLAIWALSLIVCGIITLRANFVADFSAFLPSRPDATQRVLVEQLRDGNLGRIIIVGLEGGSPEARHTSSRKLAAALRQSPHFTGVQNGEADILARDRAYYFENRYLLSAASTPEHFSATGLRDAIADTLDNLSGSGGLIMKSLLARDPTGETLNLIDSFSQKSGPRTVDGVWVSRDDLRALLLLQTRASGSDIDGIEAAMQEIEKHFSNTRSDASLKLLMTGAGVFSVESRESIKSECSRLALLSTALVVAMLLFIYRSTLLLALGLLPVACGALVGIAAVSLGFGQVHGLTLGFGTTLIGEAVDYAIYFFIQSREADDAQRQHFWHTVSIGVLTSICGFAALLVSGFPGLAQLGLYSIGGLVSAACITRWVLPLLLPANTDIRDLTPLGDTLQSVCARLAGLRVALLAITVGGFIWLSFQHDTLWNRSISALNPVPIEQQELDGALRAELGAPDARFLLSLDCPDTEAALQAAEALNPELEQLVADGIIGGFETPVRMLPSQRTQKLRQAALPDAATLRSHLAAAQKDSPLRAERLGGFVDDVEKARTRALLTRADLKGTASALALDTMLVQKASSVALLIPLRALQKAELDAATLRERLDKQAPQEAKGTLLIDLRDQAETLYAGYFSEAIQLAGWGCLTVFLIIAFAVRDARIVLRISLPLAGSVVLTMLILQLGGHALSILHLIGLLLTVAIGSNYALFFNQPDNTSPSAARGRMLASLLIANLATVTGFGLLATASVPVLQALGETVGLGTLLSLILSAVFAPATLDSRHTPNTGPDAIAS